MKERSQYGMEHRKENSLLGGFWDALMYHFIDSAIEPAGVILASHWEANNYSLGKVIQTDSYKKQISIRK